MVKKLERAERRDVRLSRCTASVSLSQVSPGQNPASPHARQHNIRIKEESFRKMQWPCLLAYIRGRVDKEWLATFSPLEINSTEPIIEKTRAE
jgi:hypothetical protein